MAAGKAHIGKLAPDFTAKAVMPDGQFQDLKLSDYRGAPHSVCWAENSLIMWSHSSIFNRHSFTLLKARVNEPVIIIHASPHCKHDLTCFPFLWCREICCLFLLSPGLHLCVSNWDHSLQWCCWRLQEDWLWGHRCFCWLALLPFCLVGAQFYI